MSELGKAFQRLTPEQQQREIIKYQSRPVEFARDFLNVDPATIRWSLFGERAGRENLYWIKRGITNPYDHHQWHGDKDGLFYAFQAYARRHREIALYAGTGLGKSVGAAILLYHFLWCFRTSKVFTLATKGDQLKDGLWSYVQMFFDDFKELHPPAQLDSLRLTMDPAQPDAWAAKGRTVAVEKGKDSAVKLHGIHGAHMLVILEEVPGIHPAVINAVKGTTNGEHNIVLGLMNPERIGDHAHEFVKNATSFRLDNRDYPNVVCRQNFVDGATSRQWVADRMREWRRSFGLERMAEVLDLPLFQQKVAGTFSRFSSNTLLNPKTLEQISRTVEDIQPHETKAFLPEDQIKGESRILVDPYEPWLRSHTNAVTCTIDPAGNLPYDPSREKARDWHAAVFRHIVDGRVLAVVEGQGLLKPFMLEVLRVAGVFSFRYPRSWQEAQGGSSAFTGHSKPIISWARTGGYGEVTLIPEVLEYESRGGYLYYSVNPEREGMPESKTYGYSEAGGGRDALIGALGAYGPELRKRPELVMDRGLAHELSSLVGVEVERNGKKKTRYEALPGEHDDKALAYAHGLHLPTLLAAVGVYPKPVPKVEAPEKKRVNLLRRPQKKKGGWDVKLGMDW